MGADYDMAATPGFERGRPRVLHAGRRRASARRAGRVRGRACPRLGARAAVQVPAGAVRGVVPPARALHAAGHPRRGADGDDVPDAAPGPGDRRGLADVPRRAWPRAASRSCPQHLVTSIDPATRVAQLASGETLPYDLFVGIPVHRAPDPLAASGLAVDGWVPVDQTNLRTRFPRVYALGDVCTGPRTVPKAGIFAEAAALVVADDIAAEISGERAARAVRGLRASATPSSAAGSSARWRSTSSAATPRRPSATSPRSRSPPRRPSSARSAGRAGSGDKWRRWESNPRPRARKRQLLRA